MKIHYVLDTHALVWYLDGDQRLAQPARDLLRDESNPLVIPAIVLAKVKHLSAKRRFDMDVDGVLRAIGSTERCTIYPVDLHVVEAMPTSLDIHDGLIVGTALVLQPVLGQVAIITCDQAIIGAGLVSTVW
jgi:PIN domain nuclease of toxin-antitoxin system